MDEKIQEIRSFIIDTFLFGDDSVLKEDTSFLQEGIIDSTGFLELISYLESHFDIKIQDDELIPQNLDSLRNIGQFLERKLTCVE
jgi:acyl carrier protein